LPLNAVKGMSRRSGARPRIEHDKAPASGARKTREADVLRGIGMNSPPRVGVRRVD
jgi:hypothetical protein